MRKHPPTMTYTPLTAQQVADCTGATLLRAAYYTPVLNAAMARHGIVLPLHQAAFLAQVGVESGGLSRLEENMNYTTPERLVAVWPARFRTVNDAAPYVRNAQALANKVYGGRMGNTQPGDGWKYHGRGLKQLTGRDNYAAYAKACGVDVVSNPDLLLHPEQAANSAAWFWSSNGCADLASKRDWSALTRRINGGLTCLADRVALTNKALATLKCAAA